MRAIGRSASVVVLVVGLAGIVPGPVVGDTPLVLTDLPLLILPRDLPNAGMAEDATIAGTWRLTDASLDADDRLTLHLAVEPGEVSSAREPGPGFLIGRVALLGDGRGDVGVGGVVAETAIATLPPCPVGQPCRLDATLSLPTDGLQALASGQDVVAWTGARVALALVRTYDDGTIVQVEPLETRGLLGTQGTVSAPRRVAGTLRAADPVPIAALGRGPRTADLLDRIEALTAAVDPSASAAPLPSSGVLAASPAPIDVTGLTWSDPIALPARVIRGLASVDGTVAILGEESNGITSRALGWASTDAQAWEPTLDAGRKGGWTTIDHVADTGRGLVAFGLDGVRRCRGGEGEGSTERCRPIGVAIWQSLDGRTWLRVDPGQAFRRSTVTGVATSPDGLLAIGLDRRGAPTSWTSADGTAWTPVPLDGSTFADADLMDVAWASDRWVITGATGAQSTTPGGVGTPNGSAGAAWTSSDGLTWTPATVEGTGEQVELREVFAGRDGLTAIGTLMGGHQGAVWTSADGTAWTLTGDSSTGALPSPWPAASDGVHILGWITPADPSGSLAWSISTDGATWTGLPPSAASSLPGSPEVAFYESATLSGGELLVLGTDARGDPLLWRALLTSD